MRVGGRLASSIRAVGIMASYPAVSMDRGTYVGPNCQIAATDGSRIQLRSVHVSRGVVIRAADGGSIEVEDSYVGFNVVIASVSHISIGPGCKIAEMVVIRDQDHIFGDGSDLAKSGFAASPISIGRNVWIGSKATILKGVRVGDGAVIAASAVVRTDVEPGAVYAGIPARRVK
jgi:acetyltransferase-like isoleucine patch superfamily enzyme